MLVAREASESVTKIIFADNQTPSAEAQNLKSSDISNSSWESIASDRLQWRHLCHTGTSLVQFENHRIASLIVVHAGRTKHGRQIRLWTFLVCRSAMYRCDHRSWGRTCTSQIGMYAHQKQCNSTSAMYRRSRATASAGSISTSLSIPQFTCSTWGRTCTSGIGMFVHQPHSEHRRCYLTPKKV